MGFKCPLLLPSVSLFLFNEEIYFILFPPYQILVIIVRDLVKPITLNSINVFTIFPFANKTCVIVGKWGFVIERAKIYSAFWRFYCEQITNNSGLYHRRVSRREWAIL